MRRLVTTMTLGPLVATLLLGLGAAPAHASNPTIDWIVEREMAAAKVPGVSYAVVSGGTITDSGGYGVMRRGSDEAVTPDTPFLIGSITKSFTALAVMQLVEAGSVDLDAAVSTYLADFSGHAAGAVTLRQLLSHTSGFSTLQGNGSHVDGTGGADELARRVAALVEVTPAKAPGTTWAYSNTNYLVLGRIIEVVSGQDYQSYVASRILAPLGMTQSFVSDGAAHDSMATGHTPWFWTKRPLADTTTSRGMAPAGGVVASAADLALYLRAMMNGRDDVLSADGKATMMRPAGSVASWYGFGWFLDSSDGRVWHDGSTPGVETLAIMIPSENKAVIVLANGGSGVGFGETAQLRNAIAAEALGLPYGGEDAHWGQKLLFVSLGLLPIGYLLSMVWAWRHRAAIRAKSGVAGLFSLWFPLLTTGVAAWVVLYLVPTLIGSPIGTLALYQPDLGVELVATAVGGVLWAVFRLVVAYTGRTRTT